MDDTAQLREEYTKAFVRWLNGEGERPNTLDFTELRSNEIEDAQEIARARVTHALERGY
jgi:hypothetical protein